MSETKNMLEVFNSIFPGSEYREIYPLPLTSDIEEYQKAKAPMSTKKSKYEDIQYTTNRIGWIVPEEYVVVDIDNKEAARIAFEILESRGAKFNFTMSRKGGHFIFKNPRKHGLSTKSPTPIGIEIDIRSMSNGYIILPHNDRERKWGYLSEEMDDLPFFLTPLKGFKLQSDFINMVQGERNSTLHKHLMALKDFAPSLTAKEKEESVRMINKFMLKEPLSDEELRNTVLRGAIIKQLERTQEKQLGKLSQMALDISREKQVISVDHRLYMYNGKYYKYINDRYMEKQIMFDYDENMRGSDRREVIDFLKLRTDIDTTALNTKWYELVVNNGVIDFRDKQLYPHTSTDIHTIAIPWDYNGVPDYSPRIDTFFNHISDRNDEKKKLLYEVIGLCLLKRNISEQFFMIVGEGSTGKSTYLKMIEHLVGQENYSALSISDINEKFRTERLFGKMVNVGDDTPFSTLKETDTLKKLVTGEIVTVERKFGEIFQFSNFATLLFTTNKLPHSLDRTTGFLRRINIIDMNSKIQDPNPHFMDSLTQKDYEYLLYKAIENVNRAITRNKLSEYIGQKTLKDNYKTDQSSILSFMQEYAYDEEVLTGPKTCREIYDEYANYCTRSGLKHLNKLNFEREIMMEFPIEKKNTTHNGLNQGWRFVKKENDKVGL